MGLKKLLRPFTENVFYLYERNKQVKAPRAKGKRVRKYAQIDITREFEVKQQKRELEKNKALNQVYADYDRKALEMKDIVAIEASKDQMGRQQQA
jgi:hypothetical protein